MGKAAKVRRHRHAIKKGFAHFFESFRAEQIKRALEFYAAGHDRDPRKRIKVGAAIMGSCVDVVPFSASADSSGNLFVMASAKSPILPKLLAFIEEHRAEGLPPGVADRTAPDERAAAEGALRAAVERQGSAEPPRPPELDALMDHVAASLSEEEAAAILGRGENQ